MEQYNPLIHKTILPVRNLGERMLFDLLESMFHEIEQLNVTEVEAHRENSQLDLSVTLPEKEPMQIEVKLVQPEKQDDEEVERQFINFK